MLAAGHSYIIRKRNSEDDLAIIMVPFPLRQELGVPRKVRYA